MIFVKNGAGPDKDTPKDTLGAQRWACVRFSRILGHPGRTFGTNVCIFLGCVLDLRREGRG